MTADISISTPPIEPLQCQLFEDSGVSVNVLRLDKGHSLLSGNKWYKLKYNLLEFQRQKELPILSFGGAYSNHLHALAAAGKILDMKTIGVIRGELPEPLNPILEFTQAQGMTLLPVSRAEYRRKQHKTFLAELEEKFGEFHLLPEGGSNALAMKGCEEIASLLDWRTSYSKRLVALSCGTGTTMAGLISGLAKLDSDTAVEVMGISVLKGEGYLEREVATQLEACASTVGVSWNVNDAYHCGGYARSNAALESFLRKFEGFSELPIEPVYTGKLFYALYDQIEQGMIERDTEVLAIHTGGVHN